MGTNPTEDAPEAQRIGMKPSFPGAFLRRTCSAAALLAGSFVLADNAFLDGFVEGALSLAGVAAGKARVEALDGST